jgi:SpoIID/LytB domain protein
MADGRLLLPLLLLLAAASLPALASDGSGRASVTVGDAAADGPAVEDVTIPNEPVDVGVVATPLRFSAGEGVGLVLADGRRYLDTLELRADGDGQTLINDLSMDDYVAGVAEMPGRWPFEALKAQAVAARTYAWYQRELGTFAGRGYDICDTVDCQAFVGAAQEEDGRAGARWRTAVDETSGEVLLDDAGRPILARYFSTSGGRTLPNEVVFPSSGPRPYLVGVDDPHDEVSPYHRWQVTFTRSEFDTILGRGDRLAAVVPVASVERLGAVDAPGATLRLTGRDGTTVELDSVDFRRFVSEVAPAAFPDRFPTRRADGLRPLPTTLPSSRFTVEVGDDEVVVDGRGWGHGVGLGQYGARGRAEAGDAYEDILAAYYDGLGPRTSDALPERIRVALSRTEVGSVRGDGPVDIVADGEVVADDAVGTWALSREGTGVRLTAPAGWGGSAVASRTEVDADAPSQPNSVAVRFAAGAPGVVRLEVAAADGTVVRTTELGTTDAGVRGATWDLTDDAGEPVPSGTYAVQLELVAADGSTAGAALPLEVERPAGPLAGLSGGDGGPRAVGPVLVLLLVGGIVVLARRRRPPAARVDGPAATSSPRPRPGPKYPARRSP